MTDSDARIYLSDWDPGLKLGRLLGQGGTSRVYELEGVHPPQVVKMMDTACLPGSDGNDRAAVWRRRRMYRYFQSEISTMRQLQSCRYVMPVLGTWEYLPPAQRQLDPELRTGQAVFLIRMPRLQTLTSYIEEKGVSEATVVQMAMDIASALQTCEDHRILHRDVKPDNIFVQADGPELHFLLGDFGFCRRLESDAFGSLTRCGTPEFMAPEISSGTPVQGFSSDLYSLGSTLYYLLSSGKLPNRQAVVDGVRRLDPLPGVSPDFARIILRAVQYEPDRRYQHGRDLCRDLKQLPPRQEGEAIPRNHFLSAKQAMLNGNFPDALRRAREGVRAGEMKCRRLLAYCLYHEYGGRDADRERQAILLLQELAYEEDPVALCLLSTLEARSKNWDEFYWNVRAAARQEHPIAQYYYGRALHDGWGGHPRDPVLGRRLVQKAAEANYLPALKYYSSLARQDADCTLTPQIRNLLQNRSLQDAEQIREDIIKFL